MVSPGQAALIVKPLLHDGPLTFSGQDKAVEINLKPVADRVVVHTGREPAGSDQILAVESPALGDQAQFLRRVSREAATSSADVDAQLVRSRRKPALQGAHDGG